MPERSLLSKWLDIPQRRPLRRALFQVHLWLGLLLGIYIVVISVSGSAVVFRREVSQWFVAQTVASTEGEKLQDEALAAAIDRTYADYTVVRFSESRRGNRPVSVLVERNGEEHGRLFDPYIAADLGESFPIQLEVMEWLVSLHDDLLTGFTGRKVNGIAGGLVVLLVLTGAVIWWSGRRSWRKSLYAMPSMSRPLWHLHSAVGFWTFLLLFNWALSGLYMGIPGPFESVIDWLDSDPNDLYRPGEGFVRFLVAAHFGRFGGLEIRILWTALGLLPAVLFITGFIVWWRRVVKPRRQALNEAAKS
jgi:uncharacterized iron-regulated membrane protein